MDPTYNKHAIHISAVSKNQDQVNSEKVCSYMVDNLGYVWGGFIDEELEYCNSLSNNWTTISEMEEDYKMAKLNTPF